MFSDYKFNENNQHLKRLKSKDSILFEKKALSPSGSHSSLHSEQRLFPPLEECSELSVACFRSDFSASRIARAVEDADAHLLNLNVTSSDIAGPQIVVDLRVSHRDAGAVSRSLERYGYTTLEIRNGSDHLHDSMAERIAGLMAQIDV